VSFAADSDKQNIYPIFIFAYQFFIAALDKSDNFLKKGRKRKTDGPGNQRISGECGKSKKRIGVITSN